LPGALKERLEEIADEYAASNLLGTGQFCTNPGIVLVQVTLPFCSRYTLPYQAHRTARIFQQFCLTASVALTIFGQAGDDAEKLIAGVKARFKAAAVGTMLGPSAADSFGEGLDLLLEAGAELVTGGKRGGGKGYCFQNTLLRCSGKQFIADPDGMQTEIFGNGGMFVVCDSTEEIAEVCTKFEGNLTGCIYSDTQGSDDALYWEIAPELRSHVGRLLNDKMPTGVSSPFAFSVRSRPW
jgi:NADP-dependent aldehyde dehydrogenase